MSRHKLVFVFLFAMSSTHLWVHNIAAAEQASVTEKQLYELRLYHFATIDKLAEFEGFLADALIPAWNRAGINHVGVFRLLESETPDLYVLLPHASATSALMARRTVMSDERLLKDGKAALNTEIGDPLYQRVESSLLLAFDNCPKLETPTSKPTRIMQLRIYESHNESKALKKIQMFNEGGEIAIFRDTGLMPVFFAEAIVGSKLPNLTYMVAFEDQEAMDKAWKAFRSHPDWLKLKEDPQYKDTVSNITNLLLRPSDCSQL